MFIAYTCITCVEIQVPFEVYSAHIYYIWGNTCVAYA